MNRLTFHRICWWSFHGEVFQMLIPEIRTIPNSLQINSLEIGVANRALNLNRQYSCFHFKSFNGCFHHKRLMHAFTLVTPQTDSKPSLLLPSGLCNSLLSVQCRSRWCVCDSTSVTASIHLPFVTDTIDNSNHFLLTLGSITAATPDRFLIQCSPPPQYNDKSRSPCLSSHAKT